MTGRDDLDELNALAASISEDTQGWRAHRRQRAMAAAQARNEAVLVAPVKRRRKHRWIAGSAMGVVVLVGAALLVMFWPKVNPPAKLPAPKTTHVASYVQAGDRAAAALKARGSVPNVFNCEGLYSESSVVVAPQHRTAAWRTGYLAACSNVVTADGSSG